MRSKSRRRDRLSTGTAVGRAATRISSWLSAVGLSRWSRVAAVAVVPMLWYLLQEAPQVRLTAGLAAYVLMSSFVPRRHAMAIADLIACVTLVILTGGHGGAFLPFLLVAVAGAASGGSVPLGAGAGAALSLLQFVTLIVTDDLEVLGAEGLLPFALLLPLTGAATALATRVLDSERGQGRLLLERANRLLSSLRQIAETIPGGLDVATVAAAALAEIRDQTDAPHAIVLIERNGVLRSAASYEIADGSVPPVRVDQMRALAWGRRRSRTFARTELPSSLQRACAPARYWSLTPVGRGDELLGALLVGSTERAHLDAARPMLLALVHDLALALDNARLFDGAQTRAADSARRQIANDLHDSVAQSLTHLRMELELLGRHEDVANLVRHESTRLARVAGTALDDVRTMITGLRGEASSGSLSRALQQHVNDLNGLADPRLTFESNGDTTMDPERCQDVLRIAQEAVSNALRHGRPRRVEVSLDADVRALRLRVEDDGVGMNGVSENRGTGIGMRAMTERATRLGARLVVRSRPGGGTVVELVCPTDAHSLPVPAI